MDHPIETIGEMDGHWLVSGTLNSAFPALSLK
jgi:hypothetical protein